ncbi:MAG: HD domain-containing protein [Trueperaceae bacterium]
MKKVFVSLTRLKNVIVRTSHAFFPRLWQPDDVFAAQQLSPPEYALYAQMDIRDRHHACLVTRTLLAKYPSASSELTRAALLHDVGKSGSSYQPLQRILVHLYTPKNVPEHPRFEGLKGAWQRNLHHSQYGAELIFKNGGDARVAELVAKHHSPTGDLEAMILKEIDELF